MMETRRRAIEDMRARGMEHLAALHETLDPGIDLILLVRDPTPLTVPLRPTRHGILVVISDDIAEGPPGFDLPSLRTLAGQAGAWAVMAGVPDVTVYDAAKTVAATGQKVVIVETPPQGELPWVRFLKRHGREAAIRLRGCSAKGTS